MKHHVATLLRRFLAEESGQDVIEYALLTSVIAIAAVLVWTTIANNAGTSYSTVDSHIQSIYRPADPTPPAP